MFVGIDWASRAHELCVVDEQGSIVVRFGFAHSERGIDEALERLAKIAQPRELPVAIERPDGLLVSRLLEAGHPVMPVHPNAFHAARPRWEGAGSKSDPGDAYRLADLLRTDHHRLRPLRPLDPTTRELQALIRLRDDQVAARVAATNQLAAPSSTATRPRTAPNGWARAASTASCAAIPTAAAARPASCSPASGKHRAQRRRSTARSSSNSSASRHGSSPPRSPRSPTSTARSP